MEESCGKSSRKFELSYLSLLFSFFLPPTIWVEWSTIPSFQYRGLGKLGCDLPGDPKPTCMSGFDEWFDSSSDQVELGRAFDAQKSYLLKVPIKSQAESWAAGCWATGPPCWIRWQHMITYDNTMCHRNMAKLRAWDKPFLVVKTRESSVS